MESYGEMWGDHVHTVHTAELAWEHVRWRFALMRRNGREWNKRGRTARLTEGQGIQVRELWKCVWDGSAWLGEGLRTLRQHGKMYRTWVRMWCAALLSACPAA